MEPRKPNKLKVNRLLSVAYSIYLSVAYCIYWSHCVTPLIHSCAF